MISVRILFITSCLRRLRQEVMRLQVCALELQLLIDLLIERNSLTTIYQPDCELILLMGN